MKIINWFINIFTFGKKGKLKKLKQISEQDRANAEAANTGLVDAMKVQFERDPHEIVMNKSQQHINDLKIYVNYFSEEDLLNKVFVQTQIIHDVFAENKELNYKSLEQFHLYYTTHLIEVLKQLKKKYDEKNLITRSKIKALKEVISKTEDKLKKITKDAKSANEKYKYASFMTLLLTSIYNCIVNNFEDFRFKSKIQYQKLTYGANFGLEYAWEIPLSVFKNVTEMLTDDAVDEKGIKTGSPYRYMGYTIERKLLGRLNREHYHVTFIGVFKLDGQSDFFELFQISDTEHYFIVHPEYGLMRTVNMELLKQYMAERTTKVGQLQEDIIDNENRIRTLTYEMKENPVFSNEINDTLNKYIETISKQELMTSFHEVDQHRKNLEAIMQLERLVI